MLSNYLTILEDSLKKKITILEHIQEVNQAQTEALKREPTDTDSFDHCVDEKDLYIEQLSKLDEGFETLYDKIKNELTGNKDKYAPQIKRLQDLIAEITDRSVSIQAQESRNKDLVTAYFKNEKQNLGQVKRSSKAAYGYYQNMSKGDDTQSSFMDAKK